MRLLSAMSTLIVVVLSSSVVGAQSLQSASSQSVPRLINITGVFRPANGQPAGPIETVTLSIYADAERGAPLWQETQTIEIDAQGRYSLLLGATRPDGIPSEVFSGEAAHWLGTVFERAGEVEGPRTRLTSVPYALRAAEADTLGGRPASDYQLAPSAGGTKDANATAADASGVSSDVVLAGTPNFLAKYVSTADVGSSAVFEAPDGAIGLGTTTPFDRIHIRYNNNTGDFTGLAVQNTNPGALAYSGMLFYDHTNALTQFQGYNNATHEYRINNIASGGSINFMLNGSSKFQVRSDGDVEIPGGIRKGGAPFLHSFGIGNTFLGLNTGNVTMTGFDNTGIGFEVLQINTAGSGNAAFGERALVSNTTGSFNVAAGHHALDHNTGGSHNTSVGSASLTQNFTGAANTAIGSQAMSANSTGNYNVAIGYLSGLGATIGSNNIYLGSYVWGVSDESNAMYLGLQGMQTKTVIAGIRGMATGMADAINVFIDSNGQLGTINSSRRYKQDIQDMGEVSSGLMKLRPVTYRYKQPYANGTKPIDYGLIAEEVESVYPDLVTHLPDGEVETVQYQKINAMLLNEVQKQHRTIEDLKARLATIEALLAAEKKQ